MTTTIIETVYRINKRGCECFRTYDRDEFNERWSEVKGNPKYTRQFKSHIRNNREHTSYWEVDWTDF